MRPLLLLMLTLGACGDSGPAPKKDKKSEAASQTKAAERAPKAAAYDGRFANDPKLDPWDVAAIPADELRRVRNEIYARHGRPFQTDDMKAYFAAQPWYKADPAYTDDRLTANDKANAALIQSFEDDGQNPLKAGEFRGDPSLMFVDKDTVELIVGQDMYEAARTERRWQKMGDWVVTWGQAPTWPQSGDRQLWKLDHKKHKVLKMLLAP